MSIALRPALEGAHIVLFGGTSGIGLAAAAAAKASGAAVTLVGRTPARLEAAARAIGGAQLAVADVADRKSVEAVFEGMASLDHLVITAGGFMVGRLADTDPDRLFAVLRERIGGALYAMKAALPLMPSTGSIVLTGGQLSDRPTGDGVSAIAAAVRGIEALARSLALELKPVRVNVVSPGFVETPLFDVLGAQARTSLLTQVAATLPGRRIGRAEEVADAITFLLGNPYVNGEVLHVDGGGRFV